MLQYALFIVFLSNYNLRTESLCDCKTRPQFHGWIRSRLLSVSAATFDRLLCPVRLQHPNGLAATRPGTLLKSQIPIRTEHWDITQPGFVEADTGAHCRHSLAGDFV